MGKQHLDALSLATGLFESLGAGERTGNVACLFMNAGRDLAGQFVGTGLDFGQRPDGVARANGLVGRLCGQASFGLVNLDEGVQLRVQVSNALEATADDLDRRNAARFEPGRQSMKASLSM